MLSALYSCGRDTREVRTRNDKRCDTKRVPMGGDRGRGDMSLVSELCRNESCLLGKRTKQKRAGFRSLEKQMCLSPSGTLPGYRRGGLRPFGCHSRTCDTKFCTVHNDLRADTTAPSSDSPRTCDTPRASYPEVSPRHVFQSLSGAKGMIMIVTESKHKSSLSEFKQSLARSCKSRMHTSS